MSHDGLVPNQELTGMHRRKPRKRGLHQAQ
jgi:hypothetical protein